MKLKVGALLAALLLLMGLDAVAQDIDFQKPASGVASSFAIPVTVSGATSGGVACFTATTTMTSSTALLANALVIGGGVGACPTGIAAGAAGTVLTGTGGTPAYSATPSVTSLTVKGGSGTGTLNVGGIICKGAPAAATTGTSEEVLATCTIPANTLSANGSTIRVSFFGHTAANGNSKQFRIRAGGIAGTVVFDSAANASNDLNLGTGYEPIVITRLSATTATSQGAISILADATAGAGGTGRSYAVRAAAITWANANDFVITGATPTLAGDLTLDTYLFEAIQ